MKRKFFNATALCGATLLLLAGSTFTACTKDYDDDLRIQRELIENNEKELRETIGAYQTEVDNLLAQMDLAYKNADARQQIEIDAAKAKLVELEQALKIAEGNVSALSSSFEAFKVAVEADFSLVRLQLQQIGVRVDGIDNRLKDAEDAIAEMENFRKATEEKIERMKKSQAASEEAIKELEAQLQVITTTIQSLKDQHNALKDIVAQQDKKLTEMINGVDTNLRDKIDALSDDLGLQITNMNTTLTSQISDILVIIHSMEDKTQEKIDAVKVELNVLIENTKIELTEALNEYKIEVNLKFEEIDSMIDDLNGSIMNFADRLDTVEAAIEALQGRIQDVRWISPYGDEMLPIYARISNMTISSVTLTEELYIVCNDPNIIEKITAPDSPYKVEVVVNEVSPVPTRAIVENIFDAPQVAAGSTANTLEITLDFIDFENVADYFFEVDGGNGKRIMKYQIAIKISDGNGNIVLSDFKQLFVETI